MDDTIVVRRKQIPVKARQFTGGITPAHDMVAWVTENGGYAIYRAFGRAGWDNEPGGEHINISDKLEQCFATVGDWVICLGDNWFETRSEEDFHDTYKEATSGKRRAG